MLASSMARLLHPRPMAEFDPDRPCRVHDKLNDKIIIWDPLWAPTWADRRDREPGVIEWDGLLLDGWEPDGPLN